MKNRIGLI